MATPPDRKDHEDALNDARLRELLGQLQAPPAPPDLLPRMMRSSMRTRFSSIVGSRRGFAFGAAFASAVFAMLALAYLAPTQLDIERMGTQTASWLRNSPFFASSDSSFWSDGKASANGHGSRTSGPMSQILNLTQADIGSQDVTAVLSVPTDLKDAVVRISLDSGIELRDLPGLNVVEWKSDFAQGENILNLSLATIEDDIDRFNSVQVRVSHPDYSTEIWINITREEHPGL